MASIIRRQWVTAQDFRPFGFHIESRHFTRRAGLRRASFSRYLSVQHVDFVASENLRLGNSDEFDRDLALRFLRPRRPTRG